MMKILILVLSVVYATNSTIINPCSQRIIGAITTSTSASWKGYDLCRAFNFFGAPGTSLEGLTPVDRTVLNEIAASNNVTTAEMFAFMKYAYLMRQRPQTNAEKRERLTILCTPLRGDRPLPANAIALDAQTNNMSMKPNELIPFMNAFTSFCRSRNMREKMTFARQMCEAVHLI